MGHQRPIQPQNMSGIEYIPLVLAFAQFLKDIYSKRRSEEEQLAGEVLYTSGMLIVLLLELYNMLRQVTDDLKHVHAYESKEKREEYIRNFRHFILLEKVMPYVKIYVDQLKDYKERKDKFYAHSVGIIWEGGQRIVDLQKDFSDAEMFRREGGFDKFIDYVRNANTDQDIDEIRRIVDGIVENFDKESVDNAGKQYAKLKNDMKDRFPSLPKPPA